MIDENLFNDVFPEITDFYNQKISPRILRIYYEYLSEHLNDEEFKDAINKMILEHPPHLKLPSAKQIVELISSSKIAAGSAEWQIIVAAARNVNPLDKSKSIQDGIANLTDRGHTALGEIGGLSAVAYHEGDLQWIHKQFIEVYEKCSPLEFKRVPPVMPERPPEPSEEDDPFISQEQLSQLGWMIRRMN